jgi:ribosomal protein S18 acetylase RimI-like enzyme
VIVELGAPEQVRAACDDDDLLVWAAQDLRGGARAWSLGDAVVAAAPAISRRDRLAVWGGARCAALLVEHALPLLGPSYRPVGERALMEEVAGRVPALRVSARFGWMSAGRVEPGPVEGAGWLPADQEAEVAALLAAAAPGSYAVPGAPGVSRWAGLRERGRLVAVAAEAWSAPTVGLLAGVATESGARGRGLAGRVCRWLSGELIAARGRAALMVDDDNAAALALYGGLGFGWRLVAALAPKT